MIAAFDNDPKLYELLLDSNVDSNSLNNSCYTSFNKSISCTLIDKRDHNNYNDRGIFSRGNSLSLHQTNSYNYFLSRHNSNDDRRVKRDLDNNIKNKND